MDNAIANTSPPLWWERLLSLPIFYKVLVANTIIVVAGAIGGTLLTIQSTVRSGSAYELVAIFAVCGTVASVIVNWFVLRAAFQPLARLERAVDQVRQGNFAVRAESTNFADRDFVALTETFNRMLDAVDEHRERLHELSMKVVTAQEEERKRISRELHDDTAQALTAQLLRLKTVEATGGSADPAVLAGLIDITAQTLESVRHMAYELRPPSLDDLGLSASLSGLAAQYRERFGLRVHYKSSCPRGRLSPVIELAVYRIAQEALTNVAKHSAASEADMMLQINGSRLMMEVRDAGCGFDPGSLRRQSGGGLGLFGMQERAALAGGSLSVDSAPNRGTIVRLDVSLTAMPGILANEWPES